MTVVINGTTGITNDGGYTGDGIVFADTTPANTLVTDTSGNVGIGTSSPGLSKLAISGSSLTSYVGVNMADTYTGKAYNIQCNNSSLVFYDSSSTLTERARIDSSGNFQFNSGYGSVATAYGCRAWVNFNGTGTVAIRASGNVSSITDNGTGDYTINFTTAMPDGNYSASMLSGVSSGGVTVKIKDASTVGTGSITLYSLNTSFSPVDMTYLMCSVFR